MKKDCKGRARIYSKAENGRSRCEQGSVSPAASPLTVVAGECAGKHHENTAGTSPGHFSSFGIFRDIYPQLRELLRETLHSNVCA